MKKKSLRAVACVPGKRGSGVIGVLMGGPSSEREISLRSGKAVVEALLRAGQKAVAVDIVSDRPQRVRRQIACAGIDCAFLALHGRFGEDGSVQSILESLGMPYTCSGVAASALAMDKIASRHLFAVRGLSVPRSLVVESGVFFPEWLGVRSLPLPVVVKPATHGSSIGLTLVEEQRKLRAALKTAARFDTRVLVEEYVRGRELTVGILGGEALPVIEIVPHRGFFDFTAKYQAGLTDYIVPARLAPGLRRRVQEAALRAHAALGCSGCSRVDLILRQGRDPVILEVNTIPGMTATSLLPKAAAAAGIDFTRLCLILVRGAYEKKECAASAAD